MNKEPAPESETQKPQGFQIHSTPVIPSQGAETEEAPSSPVSEPSSEAAADIDFLGELPRTYGTDTIFLVAQEPHWLFTYWDIDISHHPGGKTFLRVCGDNDCVESEIEVPFETRNWYIPVKCAGSLYTVEIGYYRSETWQTISRSVSITTPPERMSNSDNFDYATIPLHISFQRLMESIQTAIQQGEGLIQALARLQKEGKLFGFDPGVFPQLNNDERHVLEALLGKDLLEELTSGGFSSEEIEARVRKHLEGKLNSAGSSELFARSQWFPSESSLFSALSTIAGAESGSWTTGALSSWAAAALTSWSAAALSSWNAAAAGVSSSSLSGMSSASLAGISSSSLSGMSSETLSSWAAGLQTGWGPAALSSWLQAAQSSWLQAAQSSWSQAAMSSWNQAAVSSWAESNMSSWGGGSEAVSSFSGAQDRSFFMHVNAEVIFYGGTDPQAKVTIDGKPVALNPDGTFRYHFVFPEGNYEIPIVAESPDKVETRTAVLSFTRGTVKKGDVGNTAQPPLSNPIGQAS